MNKLKKFWCDALIRRLAKSHLKLLILNALNKSTNHSAYRQELLDRLSLKHYTNFHEALKVLEELDLIIQEKQYNKHSQPIKVVLNKESFDELCKFGLQDLILINESSRGSRND